MSEYSVDPAGAPGQNPQMTNQQPATQQQVPAQGQVPAQQAPAQQGQVPAQQMPSGAQGAPVPGVAAQTPPAQAGGTQTGVAQNGAAPAGQDVIGAGTPQPQSDNTLQRDPDEWATGDEPMTEAQKSYLDTLARENGEQLPANLTKAEASKHIDRLQKGSPRTQQ